MPWPPRCTKTPQTCLIQNLAHPSFSTSFASLKSVPRLEAGEALRSVRKNTHRNCNCHVPVSSVTISVIFRPTRYLIWNAYKIKSRTAAQWQQATSLSRAAQARILAGAFNPNLFAFATLARGRGVGPPGQRPRLGSSPVKIFSRPNLSQKFKFLFFFPILKSAKISSIYFCTFRNSNLYKLYVHFNQLFMNYSNMNFVLDFE